MADREKVIKEMEEVIAEAVYPDRPRKFMMSLELAEDTLALLKTQEPVEPKKLLARSALGYKWRFYCGECGSEIDRIDEYCRHCGHKVKQQ